MWFVKDPKELMMFALNSRLKYMAQKVTLSEPTVAVLGKRRMIRDAVTKVEAAEPAIGRFR